MTTTIKNGTIVTADLTYNADLQIEGPRTAARGAGSGPGHWKAAGG